MRAASERDFTPSIFFASSARRVFTRIDVVATAIIVSPGFGLPIYNVSEEQGCEKHVAKGNPPVEGDEPPPEFAAKKKGSR